MRLTGKEADAVLAIDQPDYQISISVLDTLHIWRVLVHALPASQLALRESWLMNRASFPALLLSIDRLGLRSKRYTLPRCRATRLNNRPMIKESER